MAAARTLRTKKRCCKSDPRCKRCPVVAKRLVKQGHAVPLGKRTFEVRAPKRTVKRARKR